MDTSPLGAARVRRRLTLEQAAARAQLRVDEVKSLEESRIYRFPSVQDALAATLVYATALRITEREARQLAGLPPGPGLPESWSLRRWLAVLAFAAACLGLTWFAVRPELVPAEPASAPPPAAARPAQRPLPPRWEIRVDVYNGTRVGNAASALANEIAGLAYRIGSVEDAKRSDYRETRVYYPPGGEAIGRRLARELGVKTAALPGGDNPRRLVVIVGKR